MPQWPVQTQGGEVNCVAIAENGDIVIAGTYHFPGGTTPAPPSLGTYAYDKNANNLWTHVTPYAAGDDGVYWVAVSRDGKWAASGGGRHKFPPPTPLGIGYVRVHEVATGTTTTPLSANIGGVNVVALNGDGSYLVAGADAAYVFARQGNTFGAPVVLRNGVTAADVVVAAAISDDGKWVVYGTSAGKVVLYANKAVSPPLSAPVVWSAPAKHYIKSIAMATDGSGFAVVTTNRANANGNPIECNAYFFSLAAGPYYFPTTGAPAWPVWPLTGCIGTLSVAINANGSRVAAVGNVPPPNNPNPPASQVTGSVFLFDAANNAQLWVKPTHHGPNCVSMDAAGQCVAASDGFFSAGEFYLFDALGAAKPIPGLLAGQPGIVSWTIQVSGDGKAIAAGSDDAKVYYFSLAAKPPAAPTNLRINT